MSTTAKIYVPKGRAREYSPYALNHYIGCDHTCSYCYGPASMRMTREEYSVPRMRQLPKALAADKQVMLSFACDPYSQAEAKNWHTRAALKLLLESNTPVAIMSKGGIRILRDLDLFKAFGDRIMVGQTLTMTDEWVNENEPNAAPCSERLRIFKILKENGIRTWASFEPIISANIALDILLTCLEHKLVDIYKFGKLNHGDDKQARYHHFLEIASVYLSNYGHDGYYIKKDLQPLVQDYFKIDPIHFDPDAWMVTSAPLGDRKEII